MGWRYTLIEAVIVTLKQCMWQLAGGFASRPFLNSSLHVPLFQLKSVTSFLFRIRRSTPSSPLAFRKQGKFHFSFDWHRYLPTTNDHFVCWMWTPKRIITLQRICYCHLRGHHKMVWLLSLPLNLAASVSMYFTFFCRVTSANHHERLQELLLDSHWDLLPFAWLMFHNFGVRAIL